MTILGKLIFAITVLFIYLATYFFGRNNSVRALQKLLILGFGILSFIAIIFPDFFLANIVLFLGVTVPTDGILYIFIVFSLAINMLIFRKFEEIEIKITRLVQLFSEENDKKNNQNNIKI